VKTGLESREREEERYCFLGGDNMSTFVKNVGGGEQELVRGKAWGGGSKKTHHVENRL